MDVTRWLIRQCNHCLIVFNHFPWRMDVSKYFRSYPRYIILRLYSFEKSFTISEYCIILYYIRQSIHVLFSLCEKYAHLIIRRYFPLLMHVCTFNLYNRWQRTDHSQYFYYCLSIIEVILQNRMHCSQRRLIVNVNYIQEECNIHVYSTSRGKQ